MAQLFKDHDTYMEFKHAYDLNAGLIVTEDHAHIVRNYDVMMDCMDRSGLLAVLQLPPHHVGVHAANRGGKTMSGKAVMAPRALAVKPTGLMALVECLPCL